MGHGSVSAGLEEAGFGECTRKSVQPHADTMTVIAAVPLEQLLLVKHRFSPRNIALFSAVGPTKQCMKPYLKLHSKLNTLPAAPETCKGLLLPYTLSAPDQHISRRAPGPNHTGILDFPIVLVFRLLRVSKVV